MTKLKEFWKRPANDYALQVLLFGIPLILLLPTSKWVSVGALCIAVAFGRVYGAIRWVDGFAEAQKVEENSAKGHEQ